MVAAGFLLVFIWGLTSPGSTARLDAATIDSNLTIDTDALYPDRTSREYIDIVDGASPPTVVHVADQGEVVSLWDVNVRDFSILNLSGGYIKSNIRTYDSGCLNVLAGSAGNPIDSFGSSKVTIAGGRLADDMHSYDFSRIDFAGGSLEDDLWAGGTSTVNVSGGTIGDTVTARESATVNVTGGIIEQRLRAQESGTINVFGSDLVISDGWLTGTLIDGTPLNVEAVAIEGGQIVLHEIEGPANIAGRHVFYNQPTVEALSQVNTGPTLASDKVALLPGQTATLANYTSFDRGINGIVVDIDNMAVPPMLGADDFEFRVGNTLDPSTWATAPQPTDVTILPGAGDGGSDRILITWDDNQIEKQWLQITVKSNFITGLLEEDVFYFGNAIGDSGNDPSGTSVNASDEIAARNDPHSFLDPAGIDNPHDYNRDQSVNATDEIIARNNGTNFLTRLVLITAPSLSPGAPVPEPSSALVALVGLVAVLGWRRRAG